MTYKPEPFDKAFIAELNELLSNSLNVYPLEEDIKSIFDVLNFAITKDFFVSCTDEECENIVFAVKDRFECENITIDYIKKAASKAFRA
ncbi:MAG: hypothetical protein ACPGVT_11205 [Maricaulaceae bacterium]